MVVFNKSTLEQINQLVFLQNQLSNIEKDVISSDESGDKDLSFQGIYYGIVEKSNEISVSPVGTKILDSQVDVLWTRPNNNNSNY